MNITELNQIVTQAERARRRTLTLTFPHPDVRVGSRVKTPFGLVPVVGKGVKEVIFEIETWKARDFIEKKKVLKAETLPGFGY